MESVENQNMMVIGKLRVIKPPCHDCNEQIYYIYYIINSPFLVK